LTLGEIVKGIRELCALNHCCDCQFGYENEVGVPCCAFRDKDNKTCNPEKWNLEGAEWDDN
jgi:hypothetical protein